MQRLFLISVLCSLTILNVWGIDVEKSPLDLGGNGNCLWDFSVQGTIAENVGNYIYQSDNVYYENISGRCRAYVLRNDSLFYRGYNIGRNKV